MIAGVRGGRALARLLIVVGLFVAWELAPLVGLVDPRLLPRATTVFATLADLLSSAGFRKGLWITLAETGVSFMIAVPLGFLLGILIAESRYMTAVLRPLIFFIFSIPKSIFLPLFILLLGIGYFEKVAFGVFSTIFIVVMMAFAAIESVKDEHVKVARSYAASRRQTIFWVYLPSMTPVFLETVRIAMIFNFTGILLAEMYASRFGLGNQIGAWGQGFQLAQLMAAILLVAALSIAFNEAVRALETRFEHWRG